MCEQKMVDMWAKERLQKTDCDCKRDEQRSDCFCLRLLPCRCLSAPVAVSVCTQVAALVLKEKSAQAAAKKLTSEALRLGCATSSKTISTNSSTNSSNDSSISSSNISNIGGNNSSSNSSTILRYLSGSEPWVGCHQ